MVVAGASEFRPGYLLDAQLEFSGREPEHGDRVQIHHGTREAPARLAWLGGRFWQIRLEQELVAAPGDRLVVREIAPPDTIGGGVVLDARPRKHGPSRDLLVRLERLSRGEPAEDERPKAAPAKPAEAKAAPEPLSAVRARTRETPARGRLRAAAGLRARRRPTWRRCAAPVARSGSQRRCTITRMCWPTSAGA